MDVIVSRKAARQSTPIGLKIKGEPIENGLPRRFAARNVECLFALSSNIILSYVKNLRHKKMFGTDNFMGVLLRLLVAKVRELDNDLIFKQSICDRILNVVKLFPEEEGVRHCSYQGQVLGS